MGTRCVGTRRLAADLGLTAAAVVDELVDDEVALDRPERMIGDPERAPGRVLQAFNARRALHRNVRIIEALALLELFLGRRTVGHRLTDLRIGRESGLHRFAEIDCPGRSGGKQQSSRDGEHP